MKSSRGEQAQASLLGDRSSNQDRCRVVETAHSILLILADGMGGHPRGEMAAQILIDTFDQGVRAIRRPVPEPRKLLGDLMRLAHRNILDWGRRQDPPIEPRTTAVTVLIQQGLAYWAHVGDSRFYLFRDGIAAQQTVDHSYVEFLRRQGRITAQQKRVHPMRNYVTRCLGGTISQPEISYGPPTQLLQSDVLLLCSDGLWGCIPTETIGQALLNPAPLQETVSRLAHQAEATAYPESDNVSVVALRWQEGPNQPARTVKSAMTTERSKNAEDPTHVDQVIDELKDAIEAFENELKEE